MCDTVTHWCDSVTPVYRDSVTSVCDTVPIIPVCDTVTVTSVCDTVPIIPVCVTDPIMLKQLSQAVTTQISLSLRPRLISGVRPYNTGG